MPTRIKVSFKDLDERDKLKNASRSVCRLISATMKNKYSLSYSGLVQMVWTKEQLDMVDGMRSFLGPIAFDAQPVCIKAPVMLDHPALPGDKPVEVDVDFYIMNPNTVIPRPFPREWTIDPIEIPVNEALAESLHSIAYEAMDFYCIRETLMHLTNFCYTYEQALYMFPYFRMVLKRSDLPEEYAEIEVRRAPSKLPETSERIRRMMKHAHTLMGMHMLLGTFDHNAERHLPSKDEDVCNVTLAGNIHFDVDNGAGKEWGYCLTHNES